MNNSLLFLLTVLAPTTAASFTGSAAKLYVTQISGVFSNEQSLKNLQEEGSSSNHDVIKVEMHPLNNIPTLNSDFTIYLEEWTAGQLTRQHIAGIKGEGDIFEVQPYEFVHPESFVSGTFNISSLESLTLNDLKFIEGCKSVFVRTGETTMKADWVTCKNTNRTPVRVLVLTDCNVWTPFVNNEGIPVSKNPYTFVKVESFPVPASILPDYEMYKSLCHY